MIGRRRQIEEETAGFNVELCLWECDGDGRCGYRDEVSKKLETYLQ